MRPLILTLTMDASSQAFFDALRRAHFPVDRNQLAAHVTLFHALPGDVHVRIQADVAGAADRAPFDVGVTGLRLLGGGVAFTLRSAELAEVRAGLVDRWSDHLTAQDRQRHAPHVTVQNKVTPAEARALHADLVAGFTPWTARGEGLALWRYLGGPWEPVATYPFAG